MLKLNHLAMLSFVALTSLSACGQNPQHSTSAVQDLSDGVPNAAATTTTGVGSHVDFYLYRDGTKPGVLYVWYSDLSQYFGAYAPLKVVAKIHTPTGVLQQSATLNTYGDGEGESQHQTVANLNIDAKTVITSIDFAVSNAAGTKWDSNNGKNYSVVLKP